MTKNLLGKTQTVKVGSKAIGACYMPPTLRKEREGWGTHCWVARARIKTWNEVWRTDGLAICSEGCHCLVVTFVGLEDRVESGAVKQFSHSLIGANQFDLTVLLSR